MKTAVEAARRNVTAVFEEGVGWGPKLVALARPTEASQDFCEFYRPPRKKFADKYQVAAIADVRSRSR